MITVSTVAGPGYHDGDGSDTAARSERSNGIEFG